MKKKQITTIKDAIQEVEKMQDSYYHGYFDQTTRELWQSRMDEIFDFYSGQIKACMLLALKKNLTSKVTYCAAINTVRYFELNILIDNREAIYIGKEMLGIPIQKKNFQEEGTNQRHYWSEYSGVSLVKAFTLLQLYFDYLNNENLYKQNGTIS